MRGGAGGPREAYSLYVEREADGANEADGPFSAIALSADVADEAFGWILPPLTDERFIRR